MVQRKTGALFLESVQVLTILSSTKQLPDFTKIVALLAELFQICDDYINLTNVSYSNSKVFVEDIEEG